jgi:hypothetical protein
MVNAQTSGFLVLTQFSFTVFKHLNLPWLWLVLAITFFRHAVEIGHHVALLISSGLTSVSYTS